LTTAPAREALAKKDFGRRDCGSFAGEEAAGATDGFRQNNKLLLSDPGGMNRERLSWSRPAHDAVGTQGARPYTPRFYFLPPRDLMEERWDRPETLGPEQSPRRLQ